MAEKQNLLSIIAPLILGSENFWEGFKDKELPGFMITTTEKQQYLQYPALRTVIKILAYPILAARIDLSGDEKQKDFLRDWFRRYYRRITKIMTNRALSWGFCAGEKIYDVVEINGAKRTVVKGVIAPESYNVTLNFSTEPLGIKSFYYSTVEVPREKMAYYVYQGDEISKPKGVSVVDDVAWAMNLLYKDWTMWQVYKKFKAISFLKMKFPVETERGTDETTDRNRAKALELLNHIKEAAGILIPQEEGDDGQYTSGWDVEEIKFAEKTSAFLDGITKEETLLFVGAFTPRKIIEQEMTIGSYGLVEQQADFFVRFVLNALLEDYEEHLNEWIIGPMLNANFGSARAEANLKLGDEMASLFVELLKEGIRTGMATPDYEEIMSSVGVPHQKNVPETEVQTGHRHQGTRDLTTFQARGQMRAALKKEVQTWINQINPELKRVKGGLYSRMSSMLQRERGKMALRVAKLFDQPTIKANELRKAVQVPRAIFGGTTADLIKAWTASMRAVIDKHNAAARRQKQPEERYLDKANLIGLRKIAVGLEGAGGINEIAGEGEDLERRFYKALLGENDRLTALRTLDTEWEQYITKLLASKLGDVVNNAAQLGVKDTIQELSMRHFKELATGD